VLSKEEQDVFYRALGKAIKSARVQGNIKQEVLSKQLGFISRISVVNIESGKQKIQLHNLLEISNILNISLNELVPQIEDVKKDINPKFAKKIAVSKEIPNEDPETKEKIKEFIRFSTARNNLIK
jgi:transcriptional regulator with XRE-family HTH domain